MSVIDRGHGMTTGGMNRVIRQLEAAVRPPPAATDGQLLAAHLRGRDDGALAALVSRHAGMVWGVCRRLLPHRPDAEDAFQATFLVLVRRAAAVRSPDGVAGWLHGVARRTALKARAAAARRRARETPVPHPPEPAATGRDADSDLRAVIDLELSHLPDKYRAALVLCELEGLTRGAAARRLGVPDGTVAAWVSRGRALLAGRLSRRGLAVPAAGLAAVVGGSAAATPPPDLAGVLAAATDSCVRAAALADGVIRGLWWARWRRVLLAAGAAVAGGVGVTGWGLSLRPAPAEQPAPAVAAHPPAALADARKLQGGWAVVGSEMDGIPDFDLGRSHDRLTFSGERVTYHRVRQPPLEGRFRLDAGVTPHHLDIEFDDGAVVRGLYEFDGPRLRFCWTKGGNRPDGFDTTAGRLLTLCYTYAKAR